MKIRFLEDTYIRKAPRVTGDPPVGTVFAGSEIDVKPDITPGDAIQNNDRWYHDNNGWYYWSGRAEEIVEEQPSPPPATAGVTSLPKPVQGLESMAGPSFLSDADSSAAPDPAQRGAFAPPSIEPKPPQIAENLPAYWQNPASQKLNWGVQNHLIARDWWQVRGLTGRGISIAILGTGVESSHPDLANIADQFQVDGNPMSDQQGLGTQAAIVAAGCGQSVFGVAPEARLLIGKLGEQDHLLTPDSLITGLRWAIDAKADIVAMLVDFQELNVQQMENLQTLVKRAVDQGILLVAPAGTSENKKPESRYPARLPGVFSVGAHDQYKQRSSFSARSYDLDLLAPGEDLLTSTPNGQTLLNLKSTAIAAAFAAGFLALTLQWLREHQQETTPGSMFDLLRETAVSRRSFNKGDDVEYGHGLLNPIETLKKLENTHV